MARPQLEDGHTKIANELVRAIARVNLSAYESRVMWCVFGKTYGWNKKFDRISYTQFEEFTGLERRHIGRTIKLLITRKMITCQGEGQRLEYAIQKDYEQWQNTRQQDIKPLPKEATPLLPNQAIVVAGSIIAPLGNSKKEDNHCLIRAEPLPNQDASLPKEAMKPLPKEANTKAIKHLTKALDKSKGEPLKQKLGEFLNVFLTAGEYEKLIVKFGEVDTKERIEQLSCGIESKGYKYTSHYATILNWARRDKEKGGINQANPRPVPKPGDYTSPEEYGRARGETG